MIATSENTRFLYLKRALILLPAPFVITLLSFTVVKAQTDPRLNPGPVNIQKITPNYKTSPGISNDSKLNAKIDYKKSDSTTFSLYVTSRYTVAEKNNDPVKTDQEGKAIIYDEESQQQREASAGEVSGFVKQIIQNPPGNFIYFLDGTETTKEGIKKLSPDKIKTINLFKNEEAVKKYGEKGRNGVIVLTTK